MEWCLARYRETRFPDLPGLDELLARNAGVWVKPATEPAAVLLGSLGAAWGVALEPVPGAAPALGLAWVGLAALLLHGVTQLLWLRRLRSSDEASREAFHRVVVRGRRLLRWRLVLGGLAAAACVVAIARGGAAVPLGAAFVLAVGAEVLGRVLFYEAGVRTGV